MRVRTGNGWIDVNFGQRFFFGQVGSGCTVFGEMGTLERATENHLVFKTDSGKVVKTKKNDISWVIGKAGRNVFVSTFLDRDYIHLPIHF